MTTMELKPCPYCGGVDQVVFTWLRASSTDSYVVVRCVDCGVRGPRMRTNANAAKAWNAINRNYEMDEMVVELGKRAKAMHRLARALRVKNRALAIAQRECQHAQERAAKQEGEQ